MPKSRELWRRISAEAEQALTLMVSDRSKGEERFRLLIDDHGEDGMLLLTRGKAFEQLGELHLAYADYLQAEELFPMQDWFRQDVSEIVAFASPPG
jgi:Flp pilus assembly protein TadD